MSNSAKGTLITTVPSITEPFHDKLTQDEIIAALVRIAGKGIVRARVQTRCHKAHKTFIEATYNAMVDPTSPASMSLKVKDFFAFSDGFVLGNKWLEDKYVQTLVVTAAHATLPRIDLVVLEPETDDKLSKCNQGGHISIIKGVAAAAPVAPALTDDDQIILAQINIPAHATAITAAMIDNSVKKYIKNLDELSSGAYDAAHEAAQDLLIETLQNQMDNVQSAINAINLHNAGVDTAIANINNRLTGYENEICSDLSKISVLSGSVTAAMATAATLQTHSATLISQVTSLDPARLVKATEIDDGVQSVAASIVSLNALVQSYAAMTSLSTSNIMGLKAQYVMVSASLDSLITMLQNLGSPNSTVNATKNLMLADCTSMIVSLVGLQTKIQDLVDCVGFSFVSANTFSALVQALGTALGSASVTNAALWSAVDKLDSLLGAVQAYVDDQLADLKVYIDDSDAQLSARITANSDEITALLAQQLIDEGKIAELQGLVGHRQDLFYADWADSVGYSGLAMKHLPDGKFAVACNGSNQILIYNADGSLFGSYGLYGTGDGQLYGPQGLAINAAGTILAIAERFNSRVQLWNYPAMTFKSKITGLTACRGVSFDSSGNLWAVASGLHTAYKFAVGSLGADQTISGAVANIGGFGTDLKPAVKFNAPRGLFIDQSDSNKMYFADAGNRRIVKTDSTGAFIGLMGLPPGLIFDLSNSNYTVDINRPSTPVIGYKVGCGLVYCPSGEMMASGPDASQVWKSNDDGYSWYGPFPTTATSNLTNQTKLLTTHTGRIIMLYVTSNGPVESIYSDDSGASWSTPVQLTNNGDWGLSLYEVPTGTYAGHIFACYFDYNLDGNHAYLIKSLDNGASWSAGTKQQVGSTQFFADTVCFMQLSGGNIMRTFAGNFASVQKEVSSDGGATWSGTTVILDGSYKIFRATGLIKLHDGTFVMTYINSQYNSAYFTVSLDEGATWSRGTPMIEQGFGGGATNGPAGADGWTAAMLLETADNSEVVAVFDGNNGGGDYGLTAVHCYMFNAVASPTTPGEFSSPWDINIGSDGYVYVGEYSASAVQSFTKDGKFVSWFGDYSVNNDMSNLRAYAGPTSALEFNGSVYVLDSQVFFGGMGRIVKISYPPSLIAAFNDLVTWAITQGYTGGPF